MIDLFNRSWELTKLSLSVVRQDKEMLLFPLLASIFSFFYTVALFVPSLITMILFPEERGAVGWVLEAGATFLV